MIVDNPKPRHFKAASSPKRKLKPRKSAFNSNLSTNYELMLRLYLINKEHKMAKAGLQYPRLAEDSRMEQTKPVSSTVWNNIVQVINKANQLISTFSHPKMEVLSK
jgi:hypothetical protein